MKVNYVCAPNVTFLKVNSKPRNIEDFILQKSVEFINNLKIKILLLGSKTASN
jgi:hypothetical protein